MSLTLALFLLAQPAPPDEPPAESAAEAPAVDAGEGDSEVENSGDAPEAGDNPASTSEPDAPPPVEQKAEPPAKAPVAEPAPKGPSTEADAAEPAPEESSVGDPTHGHILDATGYLLQGRTAELGLFYMGYGITDWLNVGIHPLIWIAGPLLGGRMGNLSIKLGTPITRWVNVGLEANATWLSLDYQGSKSRGFVIPATLGVSVNATESQSYSLAGRYISIHGGNETDLESQEIEGGALARSVQLIGDASWRLSDTFGLYARSYVQPWSQNLKVEGETQVDEQTTVTVEGEASASDDTTPWSVLGGMQFHWGFANLRVGVGYGRYFVPRISVPLFKSVYPDLDFYARF